MSSPRPLTRRHFIQQAGNVSLGVATLSLLPQPGLFADAPSAKALDAELAERVSDAAIARRKARVVRAFAVDPSFNVKKTNPRNQHAFVGGRLAHNPKDSVALDYLGRVAGFDDKFAYQGLAANFARFSKDWSPELIETVRTSVTGWVGFLGGGTENMVAMRRAAGVIFGEAFPEAAFQNGLTGRQLLEECKKFMSLYGHAVFGGSMIEYLSPIYVGVSSQAWVNVAEFAKDDGGAADG